MRLELGLSGMVGGVFRRMCRAGNVILTSVCWKDEVARCECPRVGNGASGRVFPFLHGVAAAWHLRGFSSYTDGIILLGQAA